MSIFTKPFSEEDRQRELKWVDSLDDPEAKAIIRSILEQDKLTLFTIFAKVLHATVLSVEIYILDRCGDGITHITELLFLRERRKFERTHNQNVLFGSLHRRLTNVATKLLGMSVRLQSKRMNIGTI